jgi:hypothetical protein
MVGMDIKELCEMLAENNRKRATGEITRDQWVVRNVELNELTKLFGIQFPPVSLGR